MKKSDRKILIISPHMDDETLGMGGTIAKHVTNGDKVHVVIVANRIYNHIFEKEKYNREIECVYKAKEALGYHEVELIGLNDERLDIAIQNILKPLERSIKKFKPEILYSNFYGDNNQDHRAVFQTVRIAARSTSTIKVNEWYLYETPSSTDQSPPIVQSAFQPNYYVDISKTFEKKICALNCYKTEKRNFPHPRSEETLKALAMKRGSEIGFLKAEAFMIMRKIWK